MTFSEKQHEELISAVHAAVKEEVNGKILALDKKLTARLDAQDAAMAPLIETFKNLKWGKNAVMGILGFLAAIGGLILLVIKIKKS